MQSINEDIKQKRYSKVYLLYGTETYLRKQYRDRLKSALIEPEDSMNYHYFEGKDISFPQVIDLAQTLPFFSERRVIIIENSSAFKGRSEERRVGKEVRPGVDLGGRRIIKKKKS